MNALNFYEAKEIAEAIAEANHFAVREMTARA
jgi:hypothetical protein